jgi:hypothetical protein
MIKKKIANNLFDKFFEIEEPKKKYKMNPKNLTPQTYDADHIKHYTNFNWQKVCTVHSSGNNNEWTYKNIDTNLMYSDHRSWVYAITVDDYIVKIGETGQPLGIPKASGDNQPISGTKCRLGRYRTMKASPGLGEDTDDTIRTALMEETSVSNHEVAFYAYKCPEIDHKIPVVNSVVDCKAQIHKQLEKKLLDYYKLNVGAYPYLNSGRA